MSTLVKSGHPLALVRSAQQWADMALRAEKVVGREGFCGYRSRGGWDFAMHYKHINERFPVTSKQEAVNEMVDMMQNLKDEILSHSRELDEMIMRYAKMQAETKEVIERHEQ